MGKDDFRGGSIANDRHAHRGDRGWTAPREDRGNDRYEPDMDRYAVGSNDPNHRSKP